MHLRAGPQATLSAIFVDESATQKGNKVEIQFTFTCSDKAVWIAKADFEYSGDYNKDVYYGTLDSKKCGTKSSVTSNPAKQLN